MIANIQKIMEGIVLFVGVPAILFILHSNRLILGTLLFAAIGCGVYLVHQSYPLFSFASLTERRLKKVMLLCLVLGAMIFAFSYTYAPEQFLNFPRERPILWALVMVLYPVISAFPQELVFRSFFFHRYEDLFSSPVLLIAGNAIAFAIAHSMFRNPIAILFTFFGGVVFATIYHRTRSLLMVCIVHAILGNVVFSSGLGIYFYHGRIQ